MFKLTFDRDVFFAQEVIQQALFKQKIQDFIQSVEPVAERCVVVLGPHSCFNVTVSKKRSSDTKQKAPLLFNPELIPIKKDLQSIVEMETPETEVRFIVNRRLIQLLQESMEAAGKQIPHIVPEQALTGKTGDISELLDQLKKSRARLAELSFLNTSREITAQIERTDSPAEDITPAAPLSKKQQFMILFAFALLCSSIAYALVSYQIMPMGWFTRMVLKPTPTPTRIVTPTLTPVPTAIPLTNEEITIRIINSSGTVGQASRLRTALQAEEYESIEVETDENGTREATLVEVVPEVGQETRSQLQELLKSSLESVSLEEVSTGEASIVIYTGKDR